MSNYIKKLQYKFLSLETQIPTVEKLFPYIAIITGLAVFYGIVTTIIGLQKNRAQIKNETSSIPYSSQKYETAGTFPFITQRNIFNIAGTIPDGNDHIISVCPLVPPVTNLPYKIQGIIYGGNSKGSLVIFEEKNEKDSNVYRLGDSLPQGGTITAITKDQILITNNQCPESLSLNYEMPDFKRTHGPQGSPKINYKEDGFERNGYHSIVSRQWINNVLNNHFSQALEDMKASPNIVSGQVKGFSLTQIIPDSIYAKLGIQNDDIVTAINGVELNDAARAIQTLNSLRDDNKYDLQILRNGQSINFKVNVQ